MGYHTHFYACDPEQQQNWAKRILSVYKKDLKKRLNEFHPYFYEVCGNHKGGSCFYQKDMFTLEQIYNNCSECCRVGIEYYLKHFGISNT